MNRYWSFQPLVPEEWSGGVPGELRSLRSCGFGFPDFALMHGTGSMAVLFEAKDPPREDLPDPLREGLPEPFWASRNVERIVATFDATSIAIQWACALASERLSGPRATEAGLLLELARLKACGLAEPGTLDAHVEEHLPDLESAHLRRELDGFLAARLLIEPGPVPFARAKDSLIASRSGASLDNEGSLRKLLLELLEAKLAQVAPAAGGEV